MGAAPYVAVVAGGQVDDGLLAAAEAVGRGLAEAGVVIVCGGVGELLAAVLRAAAGAGGTTVALLPGTERPAEADDATVAIPTGLGEARNVLIVRSAHATVAIGGGFGTLSEMALAARAGIPIVGYRTWTLRPPALDGGDDPVVVVTTPADAVTAALAFVTG